MKKNKKLEKYDWTMCKRGSKYYFFIYKKSDKNNDFPLHELTATTPAKLFIKVLDLLDELK